MTRTQRRPGRPAGGQLEVDLDTILDAAELVIARDGPSASLDAIAAAAGLTKPSVYARVGDRAGLAEALGDRLVERLVERTASTLAAGLDHGALSAFFRRTLEVIREHDELFRYVTLSGSGGGTDRTLDFATRSATPLATLLADWRRARGLDTTVATAWAYAIIGMMNIVALWWLEDVGSDPAVVADQLAGLVWTGIDAHG